MIRENIRKGYKSLGISQTKLAWNIGISRQRLSRLMCDESLFTIGTLEDIATQLGCTLADLMGFDGEAQEKLDKMFEIMARGDDMHLVKGDECLKTYSALERDQVGHAVNLNKAMKGQVVSEEETNKLRDDML